MVKYRSAESTRRDGEELRDVQWEECLRGLEGEAERGWACVCVTDCVGVQRRKTKDSGASQLRAWGSCEQNER